MILADKKKEVSDIIAMLIYDTSDAAKRKIIHSQILHDSNICKHMDLALTYLHHCNRY